MREEKLINSKRIISILENNGFVFTHSIDSWIRCHASKDGKKTSEYDIDNETLIFYHSDGSVLAILQENELTETSIIHYATPIKMNTIIPPITDPLGQYWGQPNPKDITINETHATMSQAGLRKASRIQYHVPVRFIRRENVS